MCVCVATKIFKITYVGHIIFMLTSSVLDFGNSVAKIHICF